MGSIKCGHEVCVCGACKCVCVYMWICVFVSVSSMTLASVYGCARQSVSPGVCECMYGVSALTSRVRARGETLTTSVILLTKWWQKISHGALMTAGVCQQALSPQR